MKKILFLVVLVAAACAPSKRVTTYTPRAPRPQGFVITDDKRELLYISADGKTWEWTGTPEEVILQLIAHANQLQQRLNPPAPVKKVVKEAKK